MIIANKIANKKEYLIKKMIINEEKLKECQNLSIMNYRSEPSVLSIKRNLYFVTKFINNKLQRKTMLQFQKIYVK